METNQTLFTQELPPLIPVNDKLPRVGQWVMVVTPSFRCLGVIDAHGIWRNVKSGDQINNVEAWQLMDDPKPVTGMG